MQCGWEMVRYHRTGIPPEGMTSILQSLHISWVTDFSFPQPPTKKKKKTRHKKRKPFSVYWAIQRGSKVQTLRFLPISVYFGVSWSMLLCYLWIRPTLIIQEHSVWPMKCTSSRQRLVSRQGIVLPAIYVNEHLQFLRYTLKPTTHIMYIVAGIIIWRTDKLLLPTRLCIRPMYIKSRD